jgi:hypothetical protein
VLISQLLSEPRSGPLGDEICNKLSRESGA